MLVKHLCARHVDQRVVVLIDNGKRRIVSEVILYYSSAMRVGLSEAAGAVGSRGNSR